MSSFALSWVDKVTTGSFQSVIWNDVSPASEEIKKSSDHVKLRLISQLINGISNFKSSSKITEIF